MKFLIVLGLVLSLGSVQVQQHNEIGRPVDVAQSLEYATESYQEEQKANTIPEPIKVQAETKGTTQSDVWERIGMCESGNRYNAVNPSGYYGRWQFNQATWNGNAAYAAPEYVGVRPDQAPPHIQDAVKDELFKRRGYQPWECASKLGIH